jgi:vancomycin resistance protein YoaR
MSPVLVYDQQFADATLRDIAGLINQPVVDAEVSIVGLEAVATPSQVGRQVDVNATLGSLERVLLELRDAEVPIVVNEVEPEVTSALDTAQTINRILAQDLEVYIAEPLPGDPGPWYASREALAEMLILDLAFDEEGRLGYTVSLSPEQLRAFLEPLAPALTVAPQDARLLYDETNNAFEPIRPSVTGRELDVAGTIQVINSMVFDGQTQVPLAFNTVEPAVADTATPEELGVTEMIASATTYFAGSSSARRANIETAAARYNGVVIAPSATFSFNEYLGDVSTEQGFEEALIIYNGRTIEGVGGGVCQVSTTAFQAAFYAGFPILERVPHAYSVGYYEVGEGIGMDATVYSPIVDMKFQNDTPHYLLIETSVNVSQAQITFRFYSTSDGRTVQKDGPYVDNIVPHGPPIYEEDPTLTPGTVKQVDYAQDGKDVTIYRIVYRDGEVLYRDTFFSQYIPWQSIYQVAPGAVPDTN